MYTLEGGIREGASPWQFYDLQTDPYQLDNLVDQEDHQDRVANHHGLLLKLLKDMQDDFPVAPAFGYPSQGIPTL